MATETIDDLANFLSDVTSDSNTEQDNEEVYEEEPEVEVDTEDNEDSDDTDDESEDQDEDSEENEDDDEGEDEDNDLESTPEEDINDKEFTVVVDGEELKVKGEELKNGYMRQAAFTKKTQELAEDRRSLAQEMNKVVEQASTVGYHAFNKLEQFNQAIEQAGGWEGLRMSVEPAELSRFSEMYQQAQYEARVAKGLVDEYSTRLKTENTEAVRDAIHNLSHTFSDFGQESLDKMDRYITENGFTEEMALNITHPQAWEMIYKAMKYDEAQSRSTSKSSKANQSSKDQPNKQSKKKYHSVPTKPIKTDTQSRKLQKAIERQRKTNGRSDATQEALALLLG